MANKPLGLGPAILIRFPKKTDAQIRRESKKDTLPLTQVIRTIVTEHYAALDDERKKKKKASANEDK